MPVKFRLQHSEQVGDVDACPTRLAMTVHLSIPVLVHISSLKRPNFLQKPANCSQLPGVPAVFTGPGGLRLRAIKTEEQPGFYGLFGAFRRNAESK